MKKAIELINNLGKKNVELEDGEVANLESLKELTQRSAKELKDLKGELYTSVVDILSANTSSLIDGNKSVSGNQYTQLSIDTQKKYQEVAQQCVEALGTAKGILSKSSAPSTDDDHALLVPENYKDITRETMQNGYEKLTKDLTSYRKKIEGMNKEVTNKLSSHEKAKKQREGQPESSKKTRSKFF